MVRKRLFERSIAGFCCLFLSVGSASGQTLDEIADAAALFEDNAIPYDLTCDGRVGDDACDSGDLCRARLGTLISLARAMEINIPSLISAAARQMTSEYGRTEANAACFNAFIGAGRPDLVSGARTLASVNQNEIAEALGLADDFVEEAPGCPAKTNKAPSIARYAAADLAQQVTFPLQALGNNAADTCVDGATGHVTQRPQVTFYITQPGGQAIDFEIVYAPCDTVLLAAAADGSWITSQPGSRRPALRLAGPQIDGQVDIWIGTVEMANQCNARLRALATAD